LFHVAVIGGQCSPSQAVNPEVLAMGTPSSEYEYDCGGLVGRLDLIIVSIYVVPSKANAPIKDCAPLALTITRKP